MNPNLANAQIENGYKSNLSSLPSKMIEVIEKEKSLSKGYKDFNCGGKNSLFYKVPLVNKLPSCKESGNNCFTWARDKLKMVDIDLGEGLTEFVITIPRTYTKVKEAYTEIPKQMI